MEKYCKKYKTVTIRGTKATYTGISHVFIPYMRFTILFRKRIRTHKLFIMHNYRQYFILWHTSCFLSPISQEEVFMTFLPFFKKSLQNAAGSAILMAVIVIFMCAGSVRAQDYSLGSEGLKAGTVAPPGFYYLMYNQYYSSDTQKNASGKDADNGFDLKTFANVHRFVWVTDKKILGADYGMNIIIPLVNVDIDIDAAGIDDSKFGLGDINIEPFFLSWHGANYDAVVGTSVFVPTGYYDKNRAASISKDHYTLMLTTGGTYYPDADRKWNLSVLTRLEKHFENQDKDVTYGNDFSFDWGAGRQMGLVNAGVSGYAHWQISGDSGNDASADKVHDRLCGIGPEIQVDVPSMKGQFRVKYYKEFDAVDTSEGDALWVTLVKAF